MTTEPPTPAPEVTPLTVAQRTMKWLEGHTLDFGDHIHFSALDARSLAAEVIRLTDALATQAKTVEEAQSIIYASDEATMERDSRIADLEAALAEATRKGEALDALALILDREPPTAINLFTTISGGYGVCQYDRTESFDYHYGSTLADAILADAGDTALELAHRWQRQSIENYDMDRKEVDALAAMAEAKRAMDALNKIYSEAKARGKSVSIMTIHYLDAERVGLELVTHHENGNTFERIAEAPTLAAAILAAGAGKGEG